MSYFDESQGGFTIMVGLIVVVMGGVGLSLMVDHRFKFSRGTVGLQREVVSNAADVERLKARYKEASHEFFGVEPKRRKVADAFEAKRSALDTTGQRRVALLADLETLRNEISGLEDEFSRYKGKYREQIWAAAKGESLGILKIRGGREYHQVVINRVTDVGLDVRHEHGIVRIHAPDLDPALQARFQWDDEEHRMKLKQEADRRNDMGAPSAVSVGSKNARAVTTRSQQASVPPVNVDLSALQRSVISWKMKVAQLAADRNEALGAVSGGSSASAPGSLETWQARSSRLARELSRAEDRLAAAKYALSLVAPEDPLLRHARSDE